MRIYKLWQQRWQGVTRGTQTREEASTTVVVEAEVEVAEAETTEVEVAVVEAVASVVEVLRSGSNTFLHRS